MVQTVDCRVQYGERRIGFRQWRGEDDKQMWGWRGNLEIGILEGGVQLLI